MDVKELKRHIIENSHVELILEDIGCHSIRFRNGSPDNYYTCANPDGDNKTAINIYLNEYLPCTNHTRNISGTKKFSPDLMTLVGYVKEISFFESLKYLCLILDIDFYESSKKKIPKSLQITRRIANLIAGKKDEEDVPLKLISENILGYYKKYVNDMFKNDGISYTTQTEFEIGYDEQTNVITIPIRSETGDLVGVKGRTFKKELLQGELKYYYIEKCPRNKILYGLYKTLPHVEREGFIYVTESEKGVLQLWDMKIKNSVGVGGKKISSQQIVKISRVCSKVIFCFDKDVDIEELENISERFIDGIEVWAIYDSGSLLDEHESPTDSKDKFEKLLKNNLIRIR